MIVPIIMCGGPGSRLWPLSSAAMPKPFLTFMGMTHSLFQQSLLRLHTSDSFHPPLIVGQSRHQALIDEQCQAIGYRTYSLLLEAEPNNTASAIAAAVIHVLALYGPSSQMLVLPADHLIVDDLSYVQTLRQAAFTLPADQIGLFGITPDHAATDYGYIESAPPPAGTAGANLQAPLKVSAFHEKPDIVTAHTYVQSRRYFWNSGIFLASVATLIEELHQHAPRIACAARQAVQQASSDAHYILLPSQAFAHCPKLSIDRALMEKSRNISLSPLQCGWRDLGTWESLCETINSPRHERPWGFFNVLYQAEGCQVKRLYISAQSRLSLQRHRHRAEHWVVLSGTAKIECNGEHRHCIAGESYFVPSGAVHRLSNPCTNQSLQIIEVQTGPYLGEDDIERLEDCYGRAQMASV